VDWTRTFVSSLLTVIALLVALGTPVRAGITDCLEAIAPVSEASKLAEMASSVSACGGEASSNPVMAAAIALMVALRVDNQFNSTDQCNALVSSTIGKLVAEALGQLGIIDEADVQSILNNYISISDIPGSEVLLHYTQCGCAIAGAADDAKKIADQYLAKVNGCVGFIGDVGGAIKQFFTSGPFKEGEHCLFDCAQLEAPVYDTPPDQAPYCAVGWAKGTIKPHMIQKLETGANGAVTESMVWDGVNYDLVPPSSCTCGQPAIKKAKVVGSAPNESVLFACKCPNGEGYKPAAGTTSNPAAGPSTCAACGANQILNKDYACQDCALGTVKNPNFNVCSPACGNTPGTVFNVAVNFITGKSEWTCRQCGAGTYAKRPIAGNSYGTCEFCPKGQKSAAGSDFCTDVCDPWMDSQTGGSCKAKCTGGRWAKVYETAEVSEMTCKPCTGNTEANYKTNTCDACPPGSEVKNGVCTCKQKGFRIIAGACLPDPTSTVTSVPEHIKASMPRAPRIDCGDQAMVNAFRPNSCIRCGALQRLRDGVCQDVGTTRTPVKPPRDTKVKATPPTVVCPRGQVNQDGRCMLSAPGDVPKPPAVKSAAPPRIMRAPDLETFGNAATPSFAAPRGAASSGTEPSAPAAKPLTGSTATPSTVAPTFVAPPVTRSPTMR
jgi:hypothetical protein